MAARRALGLNRSSSYVRSRRSRLLPPASEPKFFAPRHSLAAICPRADDNEGRAVVAWMSYSAVMLIIRVDREMKGRDPISMWLETVSPFRLGPRDQALRFRTEGEANRVAAAAKLVGWTLEDD